MPVIGPMHNDVKQCFHGTNESIMTSYFPEVANLNGSNADWCSDVAWPSSSGTGDLFELSNRSNETIVLLYPPLQALLAALLDLRVTTTPILPLGRFASSCTRSIGPLRHSLVNYAHFDGFLLAVFSAVVPTSKNTFGFTHKRVSQRLHNLEFCY